MKNSAGKASWLSHLPVQTKMLLAFGSLLLLLVLNSVAFLFVQAEQGRARAITLHTYQVLGAVDDLLIQSLNQQTGLRGYLLTADESLLEPYRMGRKGFADDLAELLALTSDNPGQQGRLQRVGEVMGDWHAEVADPAIAEFSTDRAGAVARVSSGRVYFERLRSVLHDTRMAEEQLLIRRSADLDAVVRAARLLTAGLLALGVLVLVLAVWLVQRQVTSPLVRLTGLMTRLAERDHGIEVSDLARRDEIGSLARALEIFKRMVIATDRSNWVKTHAGEISNQLQQVKNQQAFAETLTSVVAPLVQAGVAVFYIADGEGEQLELLGSYGFRQRRHVTPSYRLGEGLVGQAARERKPIVLDTVPEDYTRIHSGTGEAVPTTVIVLPILSQGRLLGVLEFASFGRFAEQHQQLLDELLPIVALSLDNLSGAIKTQELLDQTQAQAEELQSSEEALRAQQEELRASNEALQAKTTLLQEQSSKLQASEEELRVQSEELQASNEELRQKGDILAEQKKSLEGLQKDTQDKADELARASQYKSDFLANMSHELRTPLNSLLILSRGLADNEDGNLSADEVESAQVIHDSGSNLLRLINDILDLSKVEAGKMELAPEELPLEVFANTLSRNFRHVAKEKGLGFQIDLQPGLPASLYVDAGKLEQIANNLLSNAFKFTKQGAVTVDIRRTDAASGREGLIAIRVTDTGIGIPAEKFAKVFQAFEQVDAGTSRHYGGTGLGLSIARGMAQLMGGDIRLESEPGKGTSFTLLLPERHGEGGAAAAPAMAVAPAPAPVAAPAAVPRSSLAVVPSMTEIPDDREVLRPGETVILIVEDDPAFARILLDMIRRKGYRGLVAMDGESGLKLAARFRPSGILLDVMLPGMDGWTVIGRLKAEAGTRHIPVHFISATEDHSRGMDLGAVGFLTKPVTKEGLTDAFEKLLHFAADRTRRVLVVDDDAAARMAVRKLISADGIEVIEANGGEAALAMLPEGNFDCLVLDLGMPGMDGFEFLDRAGKTGPVPPVVVYSGRELSRDENLRLRQYTDSIVIKGARSPERLLDEVSLFLHSVRDAAAPAPSAEREGDRTLNDRTVLLVDDDMRNIFALSKALRAKGLKVVMAQDGHKALRQLEETPDIEIVLMDIMMPGMDGYETMREIRKNPRHQRLPMIALTAKAMRGDREKCLEAGANDYLSKPVDLDKLFSLMRVWLGGA